MILEEFDNNRRAIINPEDLIETLPARFSRNSGVLLCP